MKGRSVIKFGDNNSNMASAPFLVSTTEGMDNEVTFIISLPISGEKGEGADSVPYTALKEILADSVPIYSDEQNKYEIRFEDYVLYMTRNESYASWDDYEIRQGRYLILFERSRLLDSLTKFVECELIEAICERKCKHYGLYCQNHIIDIITANEPVIREYHK